MRYPKSVTFSIHVEPDELNEVHGSFATGDDRADRRLVNEIIKRANDGDEWAWCVVTVVATDQRSGCEGQASLCACSYRDEADFKRGGYYADLKSEAYTDLLSQCRIAGAKRPGGGPHDGGKRRSVKRVTNTDLPAGFTVKQDATGMFVLSDGGVELEKFWTKREAATAARRMAKFVDAANTVPAGLTAAERRAWDELSPQVQANLRRLSPRDRKRQLQMELKAELAVRRYERTASPALKASHKGLSARVDRDDAAQVKRIRRLSRGL